MFISIFHFWHTQSRKTKKYDIQLKADIAKYCFIFLCKIKIFKNIFRLFLQISFFCFLKIENLTQKILYEKSKSVSCVLSKQIFLAHIIKTFFIFPQARNSQNSQKNNSQKNLFHIITTKSLKTVLSISSKKKFRGCQQKT